MSTTLSLSTLQAHMSPATGTALTLLGLLVVFGLLIYVYTTRKRARARDEEQAVLEAHLDRRTKELADAERLFDAERAASEKQRRLLLRELTHRSKNSWLISHIARHPCNKPYSHEFLDRFGAQLHAIGMRDLLVADDWRSVIADTGGQQWTPTPMGRRPGWRSKVRMSCLSQVHAQSQSRIMS